MCIQKYWTTDKHTEPLRAASRVRNKEECSAGFQCFHCYRGYRQIDKTFTEHGKFLVKTKDSQ